jgi:nicotinamide-nucleotide amidase
MNASILAIGTELTTGQIVNRNASTISQKLKSFGLTVTTHLCVPDDKNIILDALKFVESQSDLLFITGGLGPTSDDFTRDMIADWAQVQLKFDEPSWQSVVERLTTRGFKVRDIQKQQCYFPENSKILKNSEGTANGFALNVRNLRVYVLPGPPREIDAIWKDSIAAELKEKCAQIEKTITKSWDTIGVGESDVAFQVESILKNRPADKFFEIGYRVHLPYVEVKISFKEREAELWQSYIENIEKGLSSITVSRDFLDVAELSLEKIKGLDFTFFDYVTGGYFHNRLSTYNRLLKNWSFRQGFEAPTVDFFENEDNFLALLPFEEDRCIILFSIDGIRRLVNCEAPMKAPLMSERRKQFYAESALIELSRI